MRRGRFACLSQDHVVGALREQEALFDGMTIHAPSIRQPARNGHLGENVSDMLTVADTDLAEAEVWHRRLARPGAQVDQCEQLRGVVPQYNVVCPIDLSGSSPSRLSNFERVLGHFQLTREI
jgi:hypothetical protein